MKKFVASFFVLILALSTILSSCKTYENNITVFSTSDVLNQKIILDFQKEYQVSVSIKYFENTDKLMQELNNESSLCDVIFTQASNVEIIKDKRLFLSVNQSNLKNFDSISQSFLKLPHDKFNRFTLPVFWSSLGILYNESKLDNEVSDWSILFNSSYKDMITMPNRSDFSFYVTLMSLEYDPSTTKLVEVDQARLKLQDQIAIANYNYSIFKISDSQSKISLAPVWTHQVIMDKLLKKDNINFVIPKNKGLYDLIIAGIYKSTGKKELSYKFIDYLIDKPTANLVLNDSGYLPCNTAPLDDINLKYPNLQISLSDDSLTEMSLYNKENKLISTFNEIWNELFD